MDRQPLLTTAELGLVMVAALVGRWLPDVVLWLVLVGMFVWWVFRLTEEKLPPPPD